MDEPYGVTPRVPRYDVVLTGAGISMGPPSSIPSGDALMKSTWARLIRDLPNDNRDALRLVTAAIDNKENKQVPIWLEPMMEILNAHVKDWNILVSTYVDVSTQHTNQNHRMLVGLNAEQITLNIDTLLEAAGGTAWHLHGRWDNPKSIVTTVRQYSDGLPPDERRRLANALHGRSVLVLGYSGRDTDVMPVLSSARPKVLHWIRRENSPALDAVHRLKRELGDAMTIFTGSAEEVLAVFSSTRSVTPSSSSPTPDMHDRFAEIPDNQRLLATAGVALDLGFHEAVVNLLNPVRFIGTHEIDRRKLLTRSYARNGDPVSGLKILTSPPRDIATFLAWRRCVNEIAAALPHAGHPVLGEVANRVLVLHPLTRVASRVRIAHRMQLSGQLTRSRDHLRAICDDSLLHQRIGVTGIVDALTIYADTLKLMGDYGGAKAIAERAMTRAAYASWPQRSLAMRRLAELAHVAGLPEVVTAENQPPTLLLDLLTGLFKESTDLDKGSAKLKDRGVAFWTAACLADVSVQFSNDEARTWLDTAYSLSTKQSQMDNIYLLLIDAERERHWADLKRSINQATCALRKARGLRLPTLVAELSLAQSVAATYMTDEVTRKLHRLYREFTRLQASSLAARAQLLLAATERAPVESLANHFRSHGWNHEANIAQQSHAEILRCSWPVIL